MAEVELLSVDQCEQRLYGDQLSEQITLRRKLINEMVGQLYPAILEAEIEKIAAIQTRKYHEYFEALTENLTIDELMDRGIR